MSQKFVMLFLVSKTKIVTLDVAAKILIEESQDTPDHSKFKSKHLHLNPLTSTKRVGFHVLVFSVSEIEKKKNFFFKKCNRFSHS